MTLRRLFGPLAMALALGSACGGLVPEDGDADAADGTGSAGGTGGLGASSGGALNPECSGRDLMLLTETLEGGAGGMTGAPVHVLSEEKSGLVQCGAGRVNRAEAVECGPPLTFDQELVCEQGPAYDEICLVEGSDCEFPYCLVEAAGCRSDEDCASGEACACASEEQSVSRCVPASCKTNDDCESGECGARIDDCRRDLVAFACRTARDECKSDEDCPSPSHGHCDYDPKAALWRCTEYWDCE